MADSGNRRHLRHQNRQNLLKRWETSSGQVLRTHVLDALKDVEPAPTFATALRGEPGADQPAPGRDLRGIDLSGQRLDGARLAHARLQAANLARASLRGAQLRGADLRDALLRNTDFTNADLREANLSGAIMENTILTEANLEGVIITNRTVAVNTGLPASVERPEGSSRFDESLAHHAASEEQER